jgi:hypothetical protein
MRRAAPLVLAGLSVLAARAPQAAAQAAPAPATAPTAAPRTPDAVPDTIRVAVLDTAAAATDEPIINDRLRGFYARRSTRKGGYFFEYPSVDPQKAPRLSEIIRGVPGVRLIGSSVGGNRVLLRGCVPLIWLDGVQTPGEELDEAASVADVAAIEVYVSPAALPGQFRDHRVSCGAVLLWSR